MKMREMLKPRTPAAPAPELPIVRVNSDSIQRLYSLFAAAQCLGELEATEEKRIRVIPGGWRDLRLCHTLLDKLAKNMKYTMPPEKRARVDSMAPRMRFRTWCGHEAIKTTPEEVVVAEKELDVLVEYAWNECSMCIEQRCSQCRLGKVFDGVMDYDRNGDSWADIDPRKVKGGTEK